MERVKASKIVVIRGPAIIAGSILNVFATTGKNAPIILEIITTKIRVIETVKATFKGVFVKVISRK